MNSETPALNEDGSYKDASELDFDFSPTANAPVPVADRPISPPITYARQAIHRARLDGRPSRNSNQTRLHEAIKACRQPTITPAKKRMLASTNEDTLNSSEDEGLIRSSAPAPCARKRKKTASNDRVEAEWESSSQQHGTTLTQIPIYREAQGIRFGHEKTTRNCSYSLSPVDKHPNQLATSTAAIQANDTRAAPAANNIIAAGLNDEELEEANADQEADIDVDVAAAAVDAEAGIEGEVTSVKRKRNANADVRTICEVVYDDGGKIAGYPLSGLHVSSRFRSMAISNLFAEIIKQNRQPLTGILRLCGTISVERAADHYELYEKRCKAAGIKVNYCSTPEGGESTFKRN